MAATAEGIWGEPLSSLVCDYGPLREKEEGLWYPLITCEQLTEAPGRLAAWLKLWREPSFALMWNLVRGALMRVHGYVEDRFMPMVAAIEAWHRQMHADELLERSEYKRRKRSAVGSVEPKLSDWLARCISLGKRKTLAERLHELLDEHAEVLDGWIRDPDDFVSFVVQIRNDTAHAIARTSAHSRDGGRMLLAVHQLGAILCAGILKELGWETTAAATMLERSNVARSMMAIGL